jgi:membrane-bound serine protease (ClpP class)
MPIFEVMNKYVKIKIRFYLLAPWLLITIQTNIMPKIPAFFFLFISLVFGQTSALFANETDRVANRVANHVNDQQTLPTLELNKILELNINASINPATFTYIKAGFEKTKKESFNALLITMNTPGGLVSTTKDILTLFGESDIPIIVWIRPEGASATSAGAIISSGAHFLYMADGTNIGAAAPVMMGKDIDPEKKSPPANPLLPIKDKTPETPASPALESSDMKKKAVNDLVALVESLSEARKRNGKLFGEMVSEAKSFKTGEALENNVINGSANNLEDIFSQMDQKMVVIKGSEQQISMPKNPQVVVYPMDLGLSLLNILAHPSLAYILFLAGAALLYFELQAPGGFIAGGIGGILLVLAGIGFQVLPLNLGALSLIILAFILFVLEMYITSFGILSIAGLTSLVFGSLFLFRSESGSAEIPYSLIASTVASLALFLLLMGLTIVREMKKNKNRPQIYSMVGKEGKILSLKPNLADGIFHYNVRTHGEIWHAISEIELAVGDKIVVHEHLPDEMILKIQKT